MTEPFCCNSKTKKIQQKGCRYWGLLVKQNTKPGGCTQFKQVSRHFRVKRTKQNKKLGKLYWKYGLRFLSTKLLFKKVQKKNTKIQQQKTLKKKHLQCLADSGDKTNSSC